MGFSVQRLHELLMELVRAIEAIQLAGPGEPVTLSQLLALHELDGDRPLSQRDLAERLRLEKSSVSRLAADLEQKGFLVRERDPANRRFYVLRLTDRGRAQHAARASAFQERFEHIVDGMTEPELRDLMSGLNAFVRAMRNPPPGAPGPLTAG
jgi:DNA-binding MarR family transcriptional regulator